MTAGFKVRYSIYALLLAMFIAALIMILTGSNPVSVYTAIFSGAFGSIDGFMSVLAYAIPLIMTGLGAVIAFQGGVFNIGGEGQLVIGGLFAAVTGVYCGLPWPFAMILALIAGFIGGALWGLIPTAMVGKNTAALFVGTVMMNSIGNSFSEYMVKYHFLRKGASTTETERILPGAVLPRINPNTQFNYGIVIAVLAVIGVAWFLYRTPKGFATRMVGTNARAAAQAGLNAYKQTLLTMFLSGGICGVGGAIQILAIYNRWILGFSPGFGWDGITVATLAGLNPFFVAITGFFFGILRSASISMNLSQAVPIDMISVLQGLVVIFVATPTLWDTLHNLIDILVHRIRLKRMQKGVTER